MIKLITDSAADIPASELEAYGIQILPIPIVIDGKTYREGVDFTPEEFYPLLENAQSIPTHSQVTAVEFEEAFRQNAAAGVQSIICVTITSKGSGIYDAACLARKNVLEDGVYPGLTIDVIDSRQYTYVYGQAVVAAAKAAQEGKSRQEVLDILNFRLTHYQAILGLTNLTYAKKSGRITTVAAFVGELMGFRPILRLTGGELITESKVRGDKKLADTLVSMFRKERSKDGRPFYVFTGNNMELAEQLRDALIADGNEYAGLYHTGGAVTTNAGPTVTGIIMPID